MSDMAPQELVHGAPSDHRDLSLDELFTHLLEAGGWSYAQLATLMQDTLKDEGFLEQLNLDGDAVPVITEDKVKDWGLKDIQPKDVHRQALFAVLSDYGSGKYADSWIAAFSKAWTGKRLDSRRLRRENAANQALIVRLQAHCLQDPQLTHLPSLFEAEQPLPLASAYVDLAVVTSSLVRPSPLHLQPALSLSERINVRIEQRLASRQSPQDLFDHAARENGLILGDPGAGKSSLLKRIALDIAKGNWKHSRVPLFIETRTYWARRQQEPTLTIIDFTIERMGAAVTASPELIHAALFPKGDLRPPGLLLIDGLDEIANNHDAVDCIYTELRHLGAHLPWIVTCRPTGLLAALNETKRCEIAALEEEASENLVHNWCVSVDPDHQIIQPGHLLQEIFRSASNREMARNPFLLAALCFLKSVAPDSGLPTSRVGVYGQLMIRIAEQARRISKNYDVMRHGDMRALEKFAYFLYDAKDGQQIFSDTDWGEFCGLTETNERLLNDAILPSRLLTTWTVGIPRFHFLHLSLQEFLVAKELVSQGFDVALSYRFRPAWRPIFRFYGALLLELHREKEFRGLVNFLFEERDITGFTYLTVAEIFSDAGIVDTTPWIGEDLRDRLYFTAMSGENVAPEALIDALATLDASWLADKASEQLQGRKQRMVSEQSVDETVTVGATLDSPYELFARARTLQSCTIIRTTFWGDNANDALLAATAFARISTETDRKEIVETVLNATSHEVFCERFLAFADTARRPEMIDALQAIAISTRGRSPTQHTSALHTIANVGGAKALAVLSDALIVEATDKGTGANGLELVLRMLVRVGGSDVCKVLKDAATIGRMSEYGNLIDVLCLEADPSDIETAQRALNDPSLSDEAISALSGAANYGRVVDQGLCKQIAKLTKGSDALDVMEIACLEGARLDAGHDPILCANILDRAILLLARLRDPDDANDRNFLLNNYYLALDTLGRAPWTPARKIVDELLFDTHAPTDILSPILDLCGRVYSGTADERILTRLKELWFTKDCELTHGIALAVGRIDLEALFRLQGAVDAFHAMEKIAADDNILVFQDFHADRTGACHPWRSPPDGVLFLFDAKHEGLSDVVAHQLAKHGYAMMEMDHARCCFALMFPQADEWCYEELQGFLTNPEHVPVRFYMDVPAELREDDVPNFVDGIVKKIESNRTEPKA